MNKAILLLCILFSATVNCFANGCAALQDDVIVWIAGDNSMRSGAASRVADYFEPVPLWNEKECEEYIKNREPKHQSVRDFNKYLQWEREYFLYKKIDLLPKDEKEALLALRKNNSIRCSIEKIIISNKPEWHVVCLDLGPGQASFAGRDGVPCFKLSDPLNDTRNILTFKYLLGLYFIDFDKEGIDFSEIGNLKYLLSFEAPANVSDEDLLKMKNLKKIEKLSIWRCYQDITGSFLDALDDSSKILVLDAGGIRFGCIDNKIEISYFTSFMTRLKFNQVSGDDLYTKKEFTRRSIYSYLVSPTCAINHSKEDAGVPKSNLCDLQNR